MWKIFSSTYILPLLFIFAAQIQAPCLQDDESRWKGLETVAHKGKPIHLYSNFILLCFSHHKFMSFCASVFLSLSLCVSLSLSLCVSVCVFSNVRLGSFTPTFSLGCFLYHCGGALSILIIGIYIVDDECCGNSFFLEHCYSRRSCLCNVSVCNSESMRNPIWSVRFFPWRNLLILGGVGIFGLNSASVFLPSMGLSVCICLSFLSLVCLPFLRRLELFLHLFSFSVFFQSNLRKFVEHVLSGQCEKITKLCNKGLDPNFHDLDNGGWDPRAEPVPQNELCFFRSPYSPMDYG